MLSLGCKAAIKAVIYLGSKCESDQRSSLKEITALTNENEHTLGKLLQKMVKAGIIMSAKGPTGGFYIIKEQIEAPIIRIVEVIDGKDVFEQCGLGLNSCNELKPCPLHEEFKPIRNKFKQMCQEKKIVDLQERITQGLFYLIN